MGAPNPKGIKRSNAVAQTAVTLIGLQANTRMGKPDVSQRVFVVRDYAEIAQRASSTKVRLLKGPALLFS
jgi:hypothetical protein